MVPPCSVVLPGGDAPAPYSILIRAGSFLWQGGDSYNPGRTDASEVDIPGRGEELKRPAQSYQWNCSHLRGR